MYFIIYETGLRECREKLARNFFKGSGEGKGGESLEDSVRVRVRGEEEAVVAA